MANSRDAKAMQSQAMKDVIAMKLNRRRQMVRFYTAGGSCFFFVNLEIFKRYKNLKYNEEMFFFHARARSFFLSFDSINPH